MHIAANEKRERVRERERRKESGREREGSYHLEIDDLSLNLFNVLSLLHERLLQLLIRVLHESGTVSHPGKRVGTGTDDD